MGFYDEERASGSANRIMIMGWWWSAAASRAAATSACTCSLAVGRPRGLSLRCWLAHAAFSYGVTKDRRWTGFLPMLIFEPPTAVKN